MRVAASCRLNRDLELTPIAVAEHDGKPVGVAQVTVVDDEADLLKLFVEPSALRSGTGKALLTLNGQSVSIWRVQEKHG